MYSFNRSKAMRVAQVAANGINSGLYASEVMAVHDALQKELVGVTGKAWRLQGAKMLGWLQHYARMINSGDSIGGVPFTIFAQGNSKLPFVSFAALPVVLCPGAGDCKSFCYSLRAWRYPAAFFRQLQNSLLLGHALGREKITLATLALEKGITVRLYTDGDFNSAQDVQYWGKLLDKRSDLQVYGYSKSFEAILQAFKNGDGLPANYRLNVSSGHNSDANTIARIKALPIVRGDFIAIADKTSSDKQLISAHKMASGNPTFLCPGQCGECTKKVHACGSDRFDNIDIIIRVH